MSDWLSRLKSGLSKSSTKLSDGITGIFTKRKLDEETLKELEELLIASDMGTATAAKITTNFGKQRLGKELSSEEIKQALAGEIAAILVPVAKPFPSDAAKPQVILLVGVNGNGKTTTIGKLAKQLQAQGKNVMLAAADTFRAAAVEQLQVWGKRNSCEVITSEANADPASVAYKAVERAREQSVDVLLIDSAGRLQNKTNLMGELQKIIKVIQKIDASAPHQVIQVLDATTGQNAISQVDVFKEMVKVSGLVITKLDGTAKGGIVVALADRFKLPIYAIGVGEGIDDLQAFQPQDFARNLLF